MDRKKARKDVPPGRLNLGIVDTTLRDGQQSLWGAKMRTEEMIPILESLDSVGFSAIEAFGGATFEAALRYLNEDPWKRLGLIKQHITRTPLQMLVRGQNLVGYRNYPDDVVEAFIVRSIADGIDIVRVFDALNDVRNLSKTIDVAKREGARAQAAICYTVSPIHTIEYYADLAKSLESMGADSICIKDAGLLTPRVAYKLVKRLKEEVDLPIAMHCHASSGLAIGCYLQGIEAGVDSIDTTITPLSFCNSLPAVESIVMALDDKLNLDGGLLRRIGDYLNGLSERAPRSDNESPHINMPTITHKVPHVVVDLLEMQLRARNALDRLGDAIEEVVRIREDFGFPPLFTPISQIVGMQAIFNVVIGERYKVVPQEVRNYVRGMYGRPPSPVSDEVKFRILGDAQEIDCRPADLLPPLLDKVREELGPDMSLIDKEEDILSYVLFPQNAIRYFRWRRDPDSFPSPVETLDRGEETDEYTDVVREAIDLIMENNVLELYLEERDIKLSIKRAGSPGLSYRIPELPHAAMEGVSHTPSAAPPEPRGRAGGDAPVTKLEAKSIDSPMVGTFYRAPSPEAPPFVEVGDIVGKGQTVCIVEAMKLMNEIQAEEHCRIVDILVENAQLVQPGQKLFIVEPV
ncbi:MAG: acetyl-CoA carboxylase biotin carboxyl carrier protein [bacterium]